jgi:hypothetical protein
MFAILLLAIGLCLLIPAVRIGWDGEYHHHTKLVISPDGRSLFVSATLQSEPFWPRYLRYIQGRPWKRQPLCGDGDLEFQEACELMHPEIVIKQADGSTAALGLAPGQRAEYERLRKIDPSAQAYEMNRRPIP